MTGAYDFQRFVLGEDQDHWDTPRGHWCAFDGRVFQADRCDPRVFVLIRCPECGEAGMLPHLIDVYGGVHPSVVCTGKGCTFHTMPTRLVGWDRPERPDTKDA